MKKKKAFTLVELLAVIVIIAFMVAILLPALRSARQKADAMACASNLRQIGTAIAAYCADHEGYYPHIPRWGMSSDGPSKNSWWSALAERGYLAKESSYRAREGADARIYPTRIFLCKSQPTVDGHPTWGPMTGMQPATCYGMNVFLDSWVIDRLDQCAYYQPFRGGYLNTEWIVAHNAPITLPDGSRTYLPVRESTVQQASEKFMVADVYYRFVGGVYRNWGGALVHNMSQSGGETYGYLTPYYGHPGNRCNVLFCDYHVGSIRSTDQGVCVLHELDSRDNSSNSLAPPFGRGIPALTTTGEKFYHWSPFAFRRDWDPANWRRILFRWETPSEEPED